MKIHFDTDPHSIEVTPRIALLMRSLAENQEEIEAQSSGEIEINYGMYQVKMRIFPPAKIYKLSQEKC